MTRRVGQLVLLVALLLWGSGVARHAHHAVAHGGPAACDSCPSAGCDRVDNEGTGGHEPIQEPRPAHDHDDCSTCQMLASTAAIVLPGTWTVGMVDAVEFTLPASEADGSVAASLTDASPRGPPHLHI